MAFWSGLSSSMPLGVLDSSSTPSPVSSGASFSAGHEYKFVGEPDVDLKCPICLQVATDPVIHEGCKKIFCRRCIRSHGENKPCPHCRRPRYAIDDQSKKAIDALPVKCDNVEKNCKWVGTVATLKDHLTKCPYAMVPCPNMCGCTHYNHKPNVFLRKDLNEHMQKKCPNKVFECKRCGHKSKASYPDIEAYSYEAAKKIHDENCSKKRVTCPNSGCSKTVQRQNMKRHYDNCEYTVLACKYVKLGCDKKLKKQEMLAHEEDDKLHLRIAMESVVQIQGKMEKLENDVKRALSTIESMEESFDDRIEEKVEEMGCGCRHSGFF